MKIIGIDAFLVGFTPQVPLGNAQTFIRRREFLLLRITTESGHAGWGEVFNSPQAASAFVKARLAPLLLGKNVFNRTALFEAMRGVVGYDKRGAARMALSAVDLAIHDVCGQVLGVSLSALLGGAVRDAVFAYGSGPFIGEGRGYSDYPAQIEDVLNKGFKALKPRAGLAPVADGKMAMAARKQVGDDIGLMVDINQGYTYAGAMESLKRMAPAGLMWVEEPVPPEDLPAYKRLAEASIVPLAGGEALGTPQAFRDFLEASTFAVLQPDPTVCGGVTGYRQIAALGMAYDLPVLPHSFGTIVNALASVQLAALEPRRRGGGPADYPYVEFDVTENPLLALRDIRLNSRGQVPVSDAPGFGLDLKPEELEPWIVDTWSTKLSDL